MTNSIDSVAGVDDFATMVKDLMAERDKLQADLAAARGALREIVAAWDSLTTEPVPDQINVNEMWDAARAALKK